MFIKAQWNWGPFKFSVGVDPLNMLPGLVLPGVGNFSFYLGNVVKFSGKDLVFDCADIVVRKMFKECAKHFFEHREKKEGKHALSNVFEVIKLSLLAITIVASLQLFGQAELYTTAATCATTAFALAVLAYHHLSPSAANQINP